MFTREELVDAINELMASSKHSIQNCEKLAAIYTVLDHISPQSPLLSQSEYSFEDRSGNRNIIGSYGDSEFLKLISGKDEKSVWKIIDELVDAVSIFNPKLHRAVLSRLSSLGDKNID